MADALSAVAVNLPIPNFEAIKSLFDIVRTLSSDTSFQAILDETAALQKRIGSKDQEIAALNLQVSDLKSKKEIAVNEMFEVNQQEKAKQAELSNKVATLEVTLKTTIEEKDKTIASITKDKDDSLVERQKNIENLNSQIQELKASFQAEADKVTQAHKDIDGLQQTVKDKDNLIDKMKTAGSAMKKELSASRTRAKELEESNTSLTAKLITTAERLQEVEGFSAKYHDAEENSLLEKFFNLWEFASQSLVLHLKEDLPTQALQDNQAWKKLRTPGILSHLVPLPATNSETAKQMRLAVVLAILAREINNHIFQPTYILPEESGVREMLASLAMADSKKEAFCRGVLLSIDPDSQVKALDARIQYVVKTVGSYVSDLLPETQFNGFQRDVEIIVQTAANIWKTVQYTRDKYEIDFEPWEWGDMQWDLFPFVKDANGRDMNAREGEVDEILLTVFPQICRVQSNGRLPRSFAVVLNKPQCVAAEQELRRREPVSSVMRQIISNRPRPRAMSLALNNHANGLNGSFLETAGQLAVQSDA